MFQKITCMSENLCSSCSIILAEDLSHGSTPGLLRGPDGRHSNWVTLGKFVIEERVSWGSTTKATSDIHQFFFLPLLILPLPEFSHCLFVCFFFVFVFCFLFFLFFFCFFFFFFFFFLNN